MNRWQPKKLTTGVVVQSGIDLAPRGARRSILDPTKRPFRALVLASRMVGDEGNVRNLGVECDLLLVRTNIRVNNVPVAQRQHGVNNVHDLWVPRPTTRVIQTGSSPAATDTSRQLNLARTVGRRGDPVGPATPLGDVDGDEVLLDFIEGNLHWPIITHALTHEQTNRVLTAGTGWREGSVAERGSPRPDELYTHHYGTEIRINEQGDLLIDTVGAYDDPTTEDASAASGQMRVRIKDGQRLTIAIGDDEDVLEVFKDGSQLRVDIGEGADEQLVLGNQLSTFIDNEIKTKVNNFWALTFNTHTHTVPMGGSTGTPTPQAVDSIASLPDAALSDLAKTKKT